MTQWDRQGPHPILQMIELRQRESVGPTPLGPWNRVLHVLRFLGSRMNWLAAGFSRWEGLAEAWGLGGGEEPVGRYLPPDKISLFRLLLSDASGRAPTTPRPTRSSGFLLIPDHLTNPSLASHSSPP